MVSNANAGFCWITDISGSFRGNGEYAFIGTNVSGYYEARVRSTTSYDGVTGVGPALSMRCRPLTDFIALANVGDFTLNEFSLSGGPPSGSPNYGQISTSTNSGSMYPWGGIQGRLGSATSATWMLSAMDHASDVGFARWPYACPLDASAACGTETYAEELRSNLHTWTYSVTGASASSDGDTTLISATGQECYIDGVWGYWTSTSEAKVIVEGDGYWHLVTTKGSASLGMGAYAACFPISQGF